MPKLLLDFFGRIHRSVFDPASYRDAAGQSRRTVFVYLLCLLALVTGVSVAAHAYYFFRERDGFAARASEALGGMAVVEGVCHPERETPYLLNRYACARALELVTGMVVDGGVLPDSFALVDTGRGADAPSHGPAVLFGKREIGFRLHATLAFSVPYTDIGDSRGSFSFDAGSLRRLIGRHAAGIVLHFVVQDTLRGLLSMGGGVAILFIAAYILNIGRGMKSVGSLSMAAYASTVTVLGGACEALSGVHVGGTWTLFMTGSFVVLFRGFRAVMRQDSERES